MTENDNWRAKCAGTIMRIRLLGAACRHESYITHQDAAELRDQLTAALEEAKRLEDPFEKWWAGLTPHSPTPRDGDYRFISPRLAVRKEEAQLVFNGVRKAAL